MALLASLNSRQQHVDGFLASERRCVALHAFQELVRIVIEHRVLKPALRNIRFRDDGQ
jgi:hypothetical protein